MDRTHKCKLSLSIVTYNSDADIGKTLWNLTKFWPTTFVCRAYVIDNCSTDLTFERIVPYLNRVMPIRSEKGNVGFGAGHNLVIPYLESEYHLIMNPDVTLLDDKALPTLVKYLDDHPDVGMVVPQIVNEAGEIQYLCRRDITVLDLLLRFKADSLFMRRQKKHTMQDKDYRHTFDVPIASGCMMMIRTDLFKQLNGFDEAFFLYSEDADLTKRVNQVSRTVYVPDAKICHAWKRSSYKDEKLFRIHLESLVRYFRKWGFKLF
jgi:GT2 family glycosyltransferase